jgi:selenide,water dikinase
MGGKPIMAIAILGWPLGKISLEVARKVLDGAKEVCSLAGIPLAGGHSIDVPEPIFGLAVTGQAPINQIRRNTDGKIGDLLYLTKPIGVGLVTTAQKRDLADAKDLNLAEVSMLKLNDIGEKLAPYSHIHAITDVTGFGLAGHLIEMAEGSECSAEVYYDKIPQFPFVTKYLELKTIPGGTTRNWESYGEKVKLKNADDFKILADPQTSGGLLISVDPNYQVWFEDYMSQNDFDLKPIGQLILPESKVLTVK